MLQRIRNWQEYVGRAEILKGKDIRRCGLTGRPAGRECCIDELEVLTGWEFANKKPGPKPRGVK